MLRRGRGCVKIRRVTGAELLLRALRAMGVERIYASPGSDWAPVWEALAGARPGEVPEYISVRHEETAVAMANGYAKASGKLPAVMLHTTVGIFMRRWRCASRCTSACRWWCSRVNRWRSPRTAAPLGRQWLRLLTDIGGPARLIEPLREVKLFSKCFTTSASTVQRACQLALSAPRGPVFMSVPIEHLMRDASAGLPTASLPAAAAPDPAALDALARELAAAQ